MSTLLKNINKSELLSLKEQVPYQEGQVVSKTSSCCLWGRKL